MGQRADTVDLTLESDEEPSPAARAEQEAAARRLIMEFARNKAATSGSGAAAVADTQTRKRLRSPAAASASPPGPPAAPPAAAGAARGSGGGLSNLDLGALHRERLARQQGASGSAGPTQPEQAAATEAAATAAAAAAAGDRDGDRPSQPGSPPRRQRQQQQQQQQQKQHQHELSQSQPKQAAGASPRSSAGRAGGSGGTQAAPPPISLLTWNVWFREDLCVVERMAAIGEVIAREQPTFVCLQEVTANIQELFEQMPWYSSYIASEVQLLQRPSYYTLLLAAKAAAPGLRQADMQQHWFPDSLMGRTLRTVSLRLGGASLVVATTHLESPIMPDHLYIEERRKQLLAALRRLDAAPEANVLFAGDMNWNESTQGVVPLAELPGAWQDVWQELEGTSRAHLKGGCQGFTYDPRLNPMLPFSKGQRLRLDRIFARLTHWRAASIRMVGTDRIPGLQYTHTYKSGYAKAGLPVLPSDHFGLLLQLEPL